MLGAKLLGWLLGDGLGFTLLAVALIWSWFSIRHERKHRDSDAKWNTERWYDDDL